LIPKSSRIVPKREILRRFGHNFFRKSTNSFLCPAKRTKDLPVQGLTIKKTSGFLPITGQELQTMQQMVTGPIAGAAKIIKG
jgi:hypothetical protein